MLEREANRPCGRDICAVFNQIFVYDLRVEDLVAFFRLLPALGTDLMIAAFAFTSWPFSVPIVTFILSVRSLALKTSSTFTFQAAEIASITAPPKERSPMPELCLTFHLRKKLSGQPGHSC